MVMGSSCIRMVSELFFDIVIGCETLLYSDRLILNKSKAEILRCYHYIEKWMSI